MPRMYRDNCGYHNFTIHEVDAAKADGWKLITDEEFLKIIEAKRKKNVVKEEPIAKQEEPAIIEPQPEPRRAGRPRKSISDFI